MALTLTGTSASLSGVLAGSWAVTVGGESFTRYEFEVAIGPAVPNGVYNVDATAMDRSGNVATLALGAVEVDKNRIEVEVAPQGLVSAPVTRDVVFVATDALGTVLKSWTETVDFSGGVGGVALDEVPGATAGLSAKMAWNLRRKLPVTLDANGQASASFTGAAELPGGDFNGDNFVSLPDYNLLRANFPSVGVVADITGDGGINLPDYLVFRVNWLAGGDPE